MMRIQIAVLFVLISTATTFSQSLSRVTSGIDLGLGYQDNVWVPSAVYHQELSLTNFPWFRIGWGVRAWGYYAGRTNMVPKSSAFSDDTLKFGRVTANGASFLLGANFRLWRFDIGANTDIVGFAFGVRRRGLYDKSKLFEGEGAPYYNSHVSSNPAAFNLVPLAMDKQNGQSEVYVRYWITDRIGLKLAYVHGRTTYSTDVKLDNGQRRFSTTYGVPYAALSFPLYN